jgi:hypothetical protein
MLGEEVTPFSGLSHVSNNTLDLLFVLQRRKALIKDAVAFTLEANRAKATRAARLAIVAV